MIKIEVNLVSAEIQFLKSGFNFDSRARYLDEVTHNALGGGTRPVLWLTANPTGSLRKPQRS